MQSGSRRCLRTPNRHRRGCRINLGQLIYERGSLTKRRHCSTTPMNGRRGRHSRLHAREFRDRARLKFARGDAAAAHRRLAEGLEIATQFHLPRLEASLLKESIRIAASSGEPVDESFAHRITSQSSLQLDVIGYDTAEFSEDAQIRLLLLDEKPSALGEACSRARTRLGQVDQNKRPRAHLHATIQLALCLAVAGHADEAQRVLRAASRVCAALGLSQLLIDEGGQIVRLAHDATIDTAGTIGDTTASPNIRDFVLDLAGTSDETR